MTRGDSRRYATLDDFPLEAMFFLTFVGCKHVHRKKTMLKEFWETLVMPIVQNQLRSPKFFVLNPIESMFSRFHLVRKKERADLRTVHHKL